MLIRRLGALAGLPLLAVTASCPGADPTGANPVAAILVIPNPVNLLQRDSTPLVVSAMTSSGAIVPDVTFTVTSADTTIAVVSTSGRVRSKDIRGLTSLTISGAGLTITVAVTVAARVTAITGAPNPISLERRDSVNLVATALDILNAPVPGQPFAFSSSDTTKATVSGTGRVRARDSLGTTSITVSGGAFSIEVPITVTTTATAIRFTPADTLIHPAETFQLAGRVVDRFELTVPSPPVTFQSLDPGTVSVTTGGLATSQSLLGVAIIAATNGPLTNHTTIAVADSLIDKRAPLASGPYGVAISSTGLALVTRIANNALGRYVLPSPISTRIAVGSLPVDVTFSSDGSRAYVANELSQNVSVLDIATSTISDLISVRGDPFSVIVAPGDSLLWVGTNRDKLYVIRLATRATIDSIGLPHAPIWLMARGDTLYAGMPYTGTVVELRFSTRSVQRTYSVGGSVQGLLIPANGSELWVVEEQGSVRVHSRATTLAIDTIPLPAGGASGIAQNPANGRIYALSEAGITLIDAASKTVIRTVATGGDPRRIAFNVAGTIGVVSNRLGWVDFIR